MIHGKLVITNTVKKSEITQSQIDVAKLEYMKDQVFYSQFAELY